MSITEHNLLSWCWGLRPIGLVFLLALTPRSALPDGGFIARDPIWEPSQVAILRHDANAGIEELILQVQFFGETRDFAWIVPVPSIPEIATADPEIFRECDLLTAPINRTRDRGWGCGGDYDVYTQPADGDLTIYSEETVGIYQTLTVGSDDATILADSLSAWGYLHEGNSELMRDVLDHYIEQSWVFVAMRIDTTQALDPVEEGLWYGALDPIGLRFETEQPVYPLRISVISADHQTDLRLFAITHQRVDFEGAKTEYANAIDAIELRNIRNQYPMLATLLSEGSFLTRLYARIGPEQMNDDLYLKPAATNEEFRPIRYYAAIPSLDFLLLFLGAAVLALRGRKTIHDSHKPVSRSSR